MHDKMMLITVVCYLVALSLLYMAVIGLSNRNRAIAAAVTLVGVSLHAWAEAQHWLIPATPQISLLNVMSLCALAIVAIPLLTYPVRNSLYDACLAALPIAVLILLGEMLIDAPALEITEKSAGMVVHIVTAIVAFGLLSIASVYAVFITMIDHLLRRHNFNTLVQTLPALDTLEGMLIHLIQAGFAVLTASLVTGLIFVNDLFGQHLGHKTILSIVAWLVFAVLLWGRWKRGWRGRVAVRMTLVGVVTLLLSYFGSKLVLEIILERSWHI